MVSVRTITTKFKNSAFYRYLKSIFFFLWFKPNIGLTLCVECWVSAVNEQREKKNSLAFAGAIQSKQICTTINI